MVAFRAETLSRATGSAATRTGVRVMLRALTAATLGCLPLAASWLAPGAAAERLSFEVGRRVGIPVSMPITAMRVERCPAARPDTALVVWSVDADGSVSVAGTDG